MFNKVMLLRTGAAVMAGAACLEIAARIAGFGHPLIYRVSPAGYELAASQTVTRMGKTTHINAYGLRGPEATPMPAPGTERILSLGDSVAQGGSQINDDQSYPALLEARLKRGGRKVEVLNGAAGGWSLENERAWLQEHGVMGASTIVLEINEKDVDQVTVDKSILDANPSFPSHYPMTAISEVLGRYIAPRLGLAKSAADPGSTPTGNSAEAEAAALTAVADILHIARIANARLLILYWDPHYGAAAPETVAARDRLFAFAEANKIPVMRPRLNDRPNWRQLFRDNMHPNSAGNIVIADQLAAAL